MIKNSLDLSRKIDSVTIKLFCLIDQVAKSLNVSYVVIGATARDIVLHCGYGAEIRKATTDIDFGIQANSWEGFKELKIKLLEIGFQPTKVGHRLTSPIGLAVDLVPFGAIEDTSSNIQWPPNGDFEMNMLGFQEAHDHAIKVIIQERPFIEISVATSQGLVLLKLIAWSDRVRDLRKKDALDLVYLLETYERVDGIVDQLYEEDGLMEQYDWDIKFASAHRLGIDSALISQEATKKQIYKILENNLNTDKQNILVEEMCGQNEKDDYEKNFSLLKAFAAGFRK